MIRARILDGRGSKSALDVDDVGAGLIVERPVPPFGGTQKMRVFRQYLTDDGTASGSTDMLVDGSSTNVDFWVPASQTKDRYICMLSFVLADAGLSLNQFGNITALSNGCRLFYTDAEGEVDINDALTTSFDFLRLCDITPAVGAQANSFIASNVSGASEGIVPKLDLRTVFGFKWGVMLAAGSSQQIVLRVRDDITAPDQFDIVAYGFERAPD